MRSAAPVLVSADERSILARWAHGRRVPFRLVQRARIVQLAADGVLFRNVPGLIPAIQAYLDTHNQNPRVFVWTASVEHMLTKVTKCTEALDALH